MDGRKANLSHFIFTELFYNNAVNLNPASRVSFDLQNGLSRKTEGDSARRVVNLVLSNLKKLRSLHLGSRWKPLPTKILISLTLSIACWQNLRTSRPMRCISNALIWFPSFLFSESKINIPARRHIHLECWQCVIKAPNISQSYFWVVRVTHNSNSLLRWWSNLSYASCLQDFTQTFSPCSLFTVLLDRLRERGTTHSLSWFVSRGSCLVTHWAEREEILCLAG